MNVLNLFGDSLDDFDQDDDRQTFSNRYGNAGHHLVMADLQIRGYESGEMGGVFADLISDIGGQLRKIQVKASARGHFGGSGGSNTRGNDAQCLYTYKDKVDAFAFVNLNARAILYMHPNAVGLKQRTLILSSSAWGRQQCEMSFDELLKRWDCL